MGSKIRYIFLISGYMGSGKDHLADYLVKRKNFVKYAAAGELKSLVQKKYKLDINLLHSQSGKNTVIQTQQGTQTVRKLLTNEALIIKKRWGSDIFITNIGDKITNNDYISNLELKPLNHIVISDFRFLNEYEYLKNKFNEIDYNPRSQYTKIITIRINRFENPPQKIESEVQLDKFNFTHYINNTKTLREFENNIDWVLAQYSF
jgi:hypothetical protein